MDQSDNGHLGTVQVASWYDRAEAQKLSEQLTNLGRPCSVIRLSHSQAAKDQMKYLGLDRASQEALQILADLGKQDGDLENEQPFVKHAVESIFSEMPTLEN